MKLTYKAISHKGLVRENNEDCLLVGNQIIRDDSDSFSFEIPPAGLIFPAIVCDGLGGHAAGEVASATICEEFRLFFENIKAGLDENELIMTVKQAASRCNDRLLSLADGNGMCTTLTGILLYGTEGFILNAGDSRVYRKRYDYLKQLTKDHITEYSYRRLISNCFGLDSVTLDVVPIKIIPGDEYIVSSDGLFDMVSEDFIETTGADVDRLLAGTLDAGGMDNVSIITLSFHQ